MTTYITRLDAGGRGLRLAVKDLIDIEGVPTTAGSRAVADQAEPAAADAPCLAGARAAGAVIVGKTNLNELAFGASGRNEHYGTPVNPVDPALLPGGSSSGSAVAVASRRRRRRLRLGHRRVDPRPGRLLRHRRAEDHARPHPAHRGVAAVTEPGHRRPAGHHRGRPGDRDGLAGARLRDGRWPGHPARAAAARGDRRRPGHRRGRGPGPGPGRDRCHRAGPARLDRLAQGRLLDHGRRGHRLPRPPARRPGQPGQAGRPGP